MKPMRSASPRPTLVAACVLLAACLEIRPWREEARPFDPGSIAAASEVRVQCAGGETLVLQEATLGTDAQGELQLRGELSNAARGQPATRTLPAAAIERLETRRIEPQRVLWNVGVVVVVAAAVTLVVGAIVVANSTFTVF